MMLAAHMRRRRMDPAWAPLTALVVAAALLAGVWASTHGGADQGVRRTNAASELLVRGHSQQIVATLSGGASVRGTLYPALPGANVVELTLDGIPSAADAGTLRIRALMPGMAMAPARATLRGHDGRYQGNIALPMFGEYVARVVLVTARGRWQGTLDLSVPLMLSR